jgi:azurin
MEKKMIWLNRLMLCGVAVALSACGPAQPPEPAEPELELVTSITITGNDRMQFDITEFAVPAGAEITLLFKNIGVMPKEAMGHNLAVIDKDMDPNVFAAAAIRHPRNEYIPPEYEDKVIATTKILGPGEEEVLIFTAPTDVGDYPYVCSFPGHTPAGMKGIMKVR